MPTDTGLLAQTHASSSPVVVEIASVATAVPRHVVTQADANERARIVYPQYARLDALYTNTGIDTRYSVEPVPWHLTTHTWEERTDSYQRNALELLEQVARQSIADAGLEPGDIDVIVTNTITGLAIPSLEARLMNRVGFRPDVERLPIFGLGCGGGVGGGGVVVGWRGERGERRRGVGAGGAWWLGRGVVVAIIVGGCQRGSGQRRRRLGAWRLGRCVVVVVVGWQQARGGRRRRLRASGARRLGRSVVVVVVG